MPLILKGLHFVDFYFSERKKSTGPESASGPLRLTASANLAYDVGQMPPIHNLGEFEQVTLLAILRLGEEAYGVTIRREIAACTGRDPAPGALYTTLDRLEEKGLLTSTMSDPTPARGGRSKRYFTVTREGVRAVANAQRAFQRMLQGLRLPGVGRA
jgi:PadR family transcriptional regulator, regulatory protein PadR